MAWNMDNLPSHVDALVVLHTEQANLRRIEHDVPALVGRGRYIFDIKELPHSILCKR